MTELDGVLLGLGDLALPFKVQVNLFGVALESAKEMGDA